MSESLNKNTRTWHPVVQVPQRTGDSTRRLLITLVIVALLVVGGVLLTLLLAIRPFKNAYLIPLSLSEYGEEFPVRSWVEQDSDALRSLGWTKRNAFTSQERESLLQELRRSAPGNSSGPLVVYLNAYALTNSSGELCIVPVDAELHRPEKWLPLRSVFQLLRESKVQHKLLLLDIMQPCIDARRGLIINDAAECLQPLLKEFVENDPHLSVLCACGPGQESMVAEELGHSVFAYFLYEGLRGEAVGKSKAGKTDGRVSLQELAKYVTTQVEQWTLRHRQARQTPRLYGAQEDYSLVSLDSQAAPPLEPPNPGDYPGWLTDAWKQRDGRLDDEIQWLLPGQVCELETSLLRAEQRWRGGFPEDQVRQELAPHLGRQHSQRRTVARNRFAVAWRETLLAYQALNADLDTVKQAQRCCEEMLALLPSYVPYLEVDAEAELVWGNAVTKVCELRSLLASPPGQAPDARIRKMIELTAALRNHRNNLNSLRHPLNLEQFEKLISRRRGGSDADVKHMTALLATPWPRAVQRGRLWSARHELLVELLQKRRITSDKAWDEAQAIEAQHRRAVERARRSVKLLELEGAAPLEPVEKALAEAAEVRTDKARLRILGAELKQAWMRQNTTGEGF